MTFENELANSSRLKVNLVIRFGTSPVTYFSKNAVDSGLTVDADKIGIVDSFKVNPIQTDLRRAKDNVDSASVKLIDKDDKFSEFMGANSQSLIGLELNLYVGLNQTPSFDFSDYVLERSLIVKSIKKNGDFYTITGKGKTDRLITSIYDTKGNLTSGISDSATSLTITTNTDSFNTSGRGKINNEFIQWTGKSFVSPDTTLTGLSRGDESSIATSHSAGSELVQAEKVTGNPIDLLLQLLLSTGDGTNGSYDVLDDGIGIPEADVDVTAFTTARDNFFSGDSFTLIYFDITNAKTFIETEFLQANNARLTTDTGKISISILDQSSPGASLPVVDEDVILNSPGPGWSISENQLINQFDVQYNFSYGLDQYTKTLSFSDTSSQTSYGVRKGATLKFKGIISDSIATDRGNRFLERFKTPFTQISTTNFLKTYSTPVGGKVDFTHSDVPNPGGVKGLNAELEILKKAIDYASGTVKATYVFTSYFNIKRGLIAPCGLVVTKLSDKQFSVPTGKGASFKAGYVLRLFDITNNVFFAEPVNTIDNVSGDIITMVNDFVNLAASTTRVEFADHGDCSIEQRSRYAFISPDSGIFANGDGSYKIF